MAKAKESHETTKQTTQQTGKNAPQTAPQGQQMRQSSGQGQGSGLSRREQFAPAVWTSPFSFMRRFGEGMDQLFADFGFGRGLMPRHFAQMADWTPQVEVFERDGQLVVRAALPGLSKDDVQVELRDNAIILRGERRQEHEEQREGYYRCEVSHGSFYREIPLPEGVNTDNAAATFRDGVLEVTMQAPQREARGRQLQILDAQAGGPKAQAAGVGR